MEGEKSELVGAETQAELLRLAREAISHYLQHRKLLPYRTDDPEMQVNSGVFVSLHKEGGLRGCIGYITSHEPVYKTVIEAAVSAAFNDPRFAPLRADELDLLDIEISLLSPPVEVSDPEDIVVGRDGLIITHGHYRGLLLPQVATEYGWDCETFLAHTCNKAGLPSDAWKYGATIERFKAQVFGETDPQ